MRSGRAILVTQVRDVGREKMAWAVVIAGPVMRSGQVYRVQHK